MNEPSINWKWTGILILVGLCLWVAFRWGSATRRLEVLPENLPETFAFSENELPEGYSLMQDTTLLQELGMERNPDYVDNLSEVAALGKRGAVCSFAAI